MPPSAPRRSLLLFSFLALSAAARDAHERQPTDLDPGFILTSALPLKLQPGLGPAVKGLQGAPMDPLGSITSPVDNASSTVIPPPPLGRPIEPFRYQSPDLLSLYPERTPHWQDPGSLCRVSVLKEHDLEAHFGIPRMAPCRPSDPPPQHHRRRLKEREKPGHQPRIRHQYAGPAFVASYFRRLHEPDARGLSGAANDSTPAVGPEFQQRVVFLDFLCLYKSTPKGQEQINRHLSHYLDSIATHPSLRNAKLVVYASIPRHIDLCFKPTGAHANRSHVFLRVEESQRCPRSHNTRYLNLPYYSSNRPVVRPFAERNGTITLVSACIALKYGNVSSVGGHVRAALVASLASKPGTYMQCTHYADLTPAAQRTTTHPELLIAIYERSRFCLVPPGDTPSSRRLSDVILAGCIPVFIGPHWHVASFSEIGLDYTRFALFYTVQDFEKFRDERPTNIYTALPPAWEPFVKHVKTPEDLYSDLMAIPTERLEPMYRALADVQPLFDMSDNGQLLPLIHQYICADDSPNIKAAGEHVQSLSSRM